MASNSCFPDMESMRWMFQGSWALFAHLIPFSRRRRSALRVRTGRTIEAEAGVADVGRWEAVEGCMRAVSSAWTATAKAILLTPSLGTGWMLGQVPDTNELTGSWTFPPVGKKDDQDAIFCLPNTAAARSRLVGTAPNATL